MRPHIIRLEFRPQWGCWRVLARWYDGRHWQTNTVAVGRTVREAIRAARLSRNV